MPGIPTPGDFAIAWASIELGLKTAVPKTVTGERFGRWASARKVTQARRGGGGLLHCSPRHCRPRRPFARPGRGRSRYWVWALIALWLRMISTPAKSGILLPTG